MIYDISVQSLSILGFYIRRQCFDTMIVKYFTVPFSTPIILIFTFNYSQFIQNQYMEKIHTFTPKVKWAQRSDKLYVTVQIRDIKNEKIDLQPDTLSFRGESDEKIYQFKIEFFSKVVVQESKWSKSGFHLQFIIIKNDALQKYWPRLIKENKKYQNIQVDWDKYVDQDDQAQQHKKGVTGQQWDPNAMQGFGQQQNEGGYQGQDEQQQGAVDDLQGNEQIPSTTKEHVHGQNCSHEHH